MCQYLYIFILLVCVCSMPQMRSELYWIKNLKLGKYVMISKSTSWHQKVYNNLKNYFMTSKNTSWRPKICYDIEKVHHNVKTYEKYAMISKSTSWHQKLLHDVNKRPLGLTAPLSNNTLRIIHSPMSTIWHWFDLSMTPMSNVTR